MPTAEASRLGGVARGKQRRLQGAESRAEYERRPKLCEYCRNAIRLGGLSVYEANRKRFCSHACAAACINRTRAIKKKEHVATIHQLECKHCFVSFSSPNRKRMFCSTKCRMAVLAADVGYKEKMRAHRYRQMRKEESVAEQMRSEGWEIFSPTVVCDRIGIRDGKAYFLEFKPRGNEQLRPGQKRLQDIAGEQFRIIVHDPL